MMTIPYQCENWEGFENGEGEVEKFTWQCDYDGEVDAAIEGKVATGTCPRCDYYFQIELDEWFWHRD